MDWKKLLKGLTATRDVINATSAPERPMSAGEKFIQATKSFSEKYDLGYKLGQNIRASRNEAAKQSALPPKKKQNAFELNQSIPQNYQVNNQMWNRVEQLTQQNLNQAEKLKSDLPITNITEEQIEKAKPVDDYLKQQEAYNKLPILGKQIVNLNNLKSKAFENLTLTGKTMKFAKEVGDSVGETQLSKELIEGWVDSGALKDEKSVKGFIDATKATATDILKQAVKSNVSSGENLGDLFSIINGEAYIAAGRAEEGQRILNRAYEQKAEDLTNSIMATASTLLDTLTPKEAVELVYKSITDKENNAIKERFMDNYAYFAALEEKSFLAEEGEETVASAFTSARQGFVDKTIGLPWQAQMAVDVAPQTYLQKRVGEGQSAGKSLAHAIADTGNELAWESIFDGFGLPRNWWNNYR